ncbi:hypothetical protein ACOSP7_016675 [Xanthoceras sorbifolium]
MFITVSDPHVCARINHKSKSTTVRGLEMIHQVDDKEMHKTSNRRWSKVSLQARRTFFPFSLLKTSVFEPQSMRLYIHTSDIHLPVTKRTSANRERERELQV